MANVKSASVREIVIDRCLREQRGYTARELMERVNETLEFEGLRPITSVNTIHNDLMNIANRWKQPITMGTRGGKRRPSVVYRYRDPDFSIFNCQLSRRELKFLYSLLLDAKTQDIWQGSAVFKELEEHIRGILHLTCHQLPILLYENVLTDQEQYHVLILRQHVESKHVVKVAYNYRHVMRKTVIVHPYFLREHLQHWHLLGIDDSNRNAISIPVYDVLSVKHKANTAYIPYSTFDVSPFLLLLNSPNESPIC